MADVHDDGREVRRLYRGSRLVGGHSTDHDGADLDSVRDHRLRSAVSARAARRRAEGANDKTKD
jgi:hypothetical protein